MKGHGKNSRRSNCKKDIKVVYISSPMKVKTCASQFRALVQELTGKDSDVAVRFMDNYEGSERTPANSKAIRVVNDPMFGLPSTNSSQESIFELFDDIKLMSEGSFQGMFTSNLFHDPSQLEAIRSFDSV